MNNRRVKRIANLIVESILVEANGNDLLNYVKGYIRNAINNFAVLRPFADKILDKLPNLDLSELLSRNLDINKVASYVRKFTPRDRLNRVKRNIGDISRRLSTEFGLSSTAVNNFVRIINAA